MTYTIPQPWIFGEAKWKRTKKRGRNLGGKSTEIWKSLECNRCGRETELLVKANDQAGLTSQAVNAEQTVPGKAKSKWQANTGKEQRSSSQHHSPLHGCGRQGIKGSKHRAGKCMSSFKRLVLRQTGSVSHSVFQDSSHGFVSHSHFDYKPLVL